MKFRRATLDDKEQIIDICKNIWEGNDYIPNTIDDWIKDENGDFYLLIDNGQIMGMGRLRSVDDKTGWMEALRVAEEGRGQGYGQKITRYFVKEGIKKGFERLQLSTYFQNHASIHIIKDNGFEQVADFYVAHLELKDEAKNDLPEDVSIHSLTENDDNYQQVSEYILKAPEQKVVRDFMGFGWFFRELNGQSLSRQVELGNVYYAKKDGQIIGGMIVYPDDFKDECYYIPLITGSKEGIQILFDWAINDAIRQGFEEFGAMIPEDEELKEFYFENGLAHWDPDVKEANVFVYEFKREGGNKDGTT